MVRGLTYHLMKLLVCRAGIENGESVDRAMQRLMPRIIFYRTDAFKQQLSYWSRDKLLRALEMLYAAEKDCKTTNMQAAEVVSMPPPRPAAAAPRPAHKTPRCQHAAVAAGGRGQTPGLENDQRKVCRVYQYLAAEIRYRTQY